MGSVRTATGDSGGVEERYEYDAFGNPYMGDLSGGMNLGYTGKPYDVSTGLYDYGHRDYKPQAARFTTVDPIKDGNNWFAYVNNDPVNWIDLWGLEGKGADIILLDPNRERNKTLYEGAQNIPHPDGTLIIVGHGASGVMSDDRNGWFYGDRMYADGVTDMIKNNPRYEQGNTVILLVCEAGKSPSEEKDSLAQQIADNLGPNSQVKATEYFFTIEKDGLMGIGRNTNEAPFETSYEYDGLLQTFTSRTPAGSNLKGK